MSGEHGIEGNGSPRRLGIVDGILAAVLIASAVLPRALVEEGPVVCLFRRITGHPCPGCGLTRSFVAMADLRLGEAFAHHVFGPLVFLGLLVAVSGRLIVGRFPRVLRMAADRKSISHFRSACS